jgi:hypothetical protein
VRRLRRSPDPGGLKPDPPASKTTRITAVRLRKGQMVLVPTSPFRFKVEMITWLERPHGQLGTVVVANLETTDAETGESLHRFHQWKTDEHVTVFLAQVELGAEFDVAALNDGNLYEQYATAAPKPPLSQEWQDALKELGYR